MIPLVTMLTAGAATSLICIIKGYDTLYSLKLLLGVLLCFYLIGLVAKKLLTKVMKDPEEEETAEEEEKGEEEEQEEQENGDR